MEKRASAIIILFHPDVDRVCALTQRLTRCHKIYLIDNTPAAERAEHYQKFLTLPDVNYLPLGENRGIAYAQNLGFVRSIADGNERFFTFDQDSTVDDHFIDAMLAELAQLEAQDDRVAALGPLIVNSRNNAAYSREIRLGQAHPDGRYAVESIISSGAVYTLEALTWIGLNKSAWFIDLIDIEWCYRARHLGWKIYTTTNVRLEHHLGQQDIQLPGRTLSLASPLRLYYVYRNWLLACREPVFPLRYKLKKMVFMPARFVIYAFTSPKRKRIKFMLKGIKDGILGRTGEYK